MHLTLSLLVAVHSGRHPGQDPPAGVNSEAAAGDVLPIDNAADIAATEQEVAKLDRSIAEAERGFEGIPHDAAEDRLYARFKQRWNEYREIVNRMLVLSRTNHKEEALAIYAGKSRSAYEAASDTLGQLTDKAVANARMTTTATGPPLLAGLSPARMTASFAAVLLGQRPSPAPKPVTQIKRLTALASIASTRMRVASANRRVPLKIRSGVGETPSV